MINTLPYLSSGAYLLSWGYQSYITNKAGDSRVDEVFWLLRLLGVAIIFAYFLLIKNYHLLATSLIGFAPPIYNIFKIRQKKFELAALKDCYENHRR